MDLTNIFHLVLGEKGDREFLPTLTLSAGGYLTRPLDIRVLNRYLESLHTKLSDNL
jgi:hypothetical protein